MPPQRRRRRPDRAYKISELPSGKFRVQSFDPIADQWVSASMTVGLGRVTFDTRTDAKRVGEQADAILARRRSKLTVAQIRDRWLTRPHKKDSTARVNEQRTARFNRVYGHLDADSITEDHWIEFQEEHGGRPSNLEALKGMFSWTASVAGGRKIPTNPFAHLKLGKGQGNAKKNPPTEDDIERMIAIAYALWPPFGAWLEFACFSGMRPSEIDALRWTDLSHDQTVVKIERQWSPSVGGFTLPKNGDQRELILWGGDRPQHALQIARQHGGGEHIFVNTRGKHFTTSARGEYWKKLKALMAWDDPSRADEYTLYLCTRHFAGWFMRNRLDMDSQDIAEVLGHTDGGKLVKTLYGHSETSRAQRRAADRFAEFERRQREERKRQMRGEDAA